MQGGRFWLTRALFLRGRWELIRRDEGSGCLCTPEMEGLQWLKWARRLRLRCNVSLYQQPRSLSPVTSFKLDLVAPTNTDWCSLASKSACRQQAAAANHSYSGGILSPRLPI